MYFGPTKDSPGAFLPADPVFRSDERNIMHAVVIGGSIAGPLAAMGIVAQGGSATVYEAHPEHAGATVGAWLTVAVNGLAAMRALGVHREIMACGFPSRTIELVSGTGKVLGAVPVGGELPDGTLTHTLRRPDLYRTIAELAAAKGVRLEYGKRFASATVEHGRAIARFEDGTEAEGDLLIGADGVHSRVRSVIDPGAPQPRYCGLLGFGGITPAGRIELAPGTYRMVFGHRAFFGYTVAPDGEVWWFANVPQREPFGRDELAARTQAEWRAWLVALLRRDRGPMADIAAATEGTITITNQHELPTVPVWHRGPLVILGDAAHAADPSSGQGVSMAAEDAVELASCLREHAELAAALAAFESRRRGRVERVVAYGASMGARKAAGPVGRIFRDLILPIVLRRIVRSTGKGALDWLYRYDAASAGMALADTSREDTSRADTSRADTSRADTVPRGQLAQPDPQR